MPINTIAYATIFQENLDLLAVQESATGWMDANAGQVKYNGGNQVKIPKLSINGLGTYDRDNGYVQGGVTLSYGIYTMTQDRGRKFQLDAMDVDEANFVPTAARVMAEFQREKVIPEIDAYRISKIASAAITNNTANSTGQVVYSYTPAAATIIEKIEDGIQYVRDCGYNGQLVIQCNSATAKAIKLAGLSGIRNTTFAQGGLNLEVPSIDNCPVIETAKNRMYTAITLYDGSTSGQTAGGYVKGATAKDVNFIIVPREVPIAVTKQDKMKIFTPEQNQDADAWKMNYRRYHDLWVMDNKVNGIFVNIKDASSN